MANHIDEGRAFGLSIALRRLIRALEDKGVMTTDETTALLDDAIEELGAVRERGAISADEVVKGSRAIGMLYVTNPPVD